MITIAFHRHVPRVSNFGKNMFPVSMGSPFQSVFFTLLAKVEILTIETSITNLIVQYATLAPVTRDVGMHSATAT